MRWEARGPRIEFATLRLELLLCAFIPASDGTAYTRRTGSCLFLLGSFRFSLARLDSPGCCRHRCSLSLPSHLSLLRPRLDSTLGSEVAEVPLDVRPARLSDPSPPLESAGAALNVGKEARDLSNREANKDEAGRDDASMRGQRLRERNAASKTGMLYCVGFGFVWIGPWQVPPLNGSGRRGHPR